MRRLSLKSTLFGVDPKILLNPGNHPVKSPRQKKRRPEAPKAKLKNGEDEIRTHGRDLTPYTGLANQRNRPLCHLSIFKPPITYKCWPKRKKNFADGKKNILKTSKKIKTIAPK